MSFRDSNDRQITVVLPDDVRGKVTMDVRAPDLTPARLREVVLQKGGRLGTQCYELSPRQGTILRGEWVENGVNVAVWGPFEEYR